MQQAAWLGGALHCHSQQQRLQQQLLWQQRMRWMLWSSHHTMGMPPLFFPLSGLTTHRQAHHQTCCLTGTPTIEALERQVFLESF